MRVLCFNVIGSHASALQVLDPAALDLAGRLPPVPQPPSDHFANFLKAAMGQETCRSNFAVAGPLARPWRWASSPNG